MNLAELFEIAGGSIPGRDHTTMQKNGHDAYHFVVSPSAMVAVVCDGCGSSDHSEVGAKLGARMVVAQVLRHFHSDPSAFLHGQIERTMAQVRKNILSQIHLLADNMGPSYSKVIGDYFLFTILGFIVTRESTQVFTAGDGIVIHNEDLHILVTPEGNTPEYLTYGLVETEKKGLAPVLKTSIIDTDKLESLLIATDGVGDLIKAADKKLPGKDEKVGPISQFWTDDRYFKNPFAIHRRLNLINRTVPQVDYENRVVNEEHGHLHDDTTLVVLRRRR